MAYLALLVIVGYALYTMKPEERATLLKRIVAAARQAKERADEVRLAPDAFRDALRQRTPWILVTPALVFLNVTVFLFMLLGSGSLGDPETLIAWGGNIAIRTTNAEWSRLVTSLFLHTNLLTLIVNMAGLFAAGVLVERLTGPVTVAIVYFMAGVLASLESLSTHSVTVSYGPSGAIFGVYGLLAAALLWDAISRRSPAGPESLSLVDHGDSGGSAMAFSSDGAGEATDTGEPARLPRIPLMTLKRLAPAAGIFLLWNVGDGLETSELAGLLAGFVCGLVLTTRVIEEKPPILRLAATAVVAVLIAVVSAYPLRGVTDARPEIARVVALEDRTVTSYQKAVDQFKLGNLSADALAKQIDQTITPELRAASARLKTLGKVPAEHQPLVKDAEEYLRLRDESWRQRAAALHKSNMPALRQADKTERASLEAFEKLKPAEQK